MKKIFAFLLLLSLSVTTLADERILGFHSDILIRQDGWIEVSETIEVQAEGNRIRRGIYRDFPTEYYDKLGNRYEVDFKPLTVLRNGSAEDFHTQEVGNGRRTYFGSSDRLIPRGRHTYQFKYQANRMLGFFEQHDELYWNVTGFDWAFPIDQASATVSFSFDVSNDISYEAYTGPFGASGSDYTASHDGANRIEFRANAPLSAANGLTIVVGWPKGYVAEPTDMQRYGWLLKDNLSVLATLAGLLALLAYYIPVWRQHGKDPDVGVIVTRYMPPEPYSPASLRYISQMYYDDKVMTAAVVNLAVKGYLRIEVEDKTSGFLGVGGKAAKHSLVRVEAPADAPPLAAGEKELFDGLFSAGDEIELDNENHKLLGAARRAHKRSLKKDYNKRYFRTNGTLNIPAVGIVTVSLIAAKVLAAEIPVLAIIAIILMFALTVFFATIMKRPTIRGRKLLDQMLGFKEYLEVAEKDELNQRNPPDKTPALFEQYLPYALALGVDQQWSEQFTEVFATLAESGQSGYQPSWYGGNWSANRLSGATQQLSSGLNSSISSSVRAPGSSSGSGGGGYSGGGGGGGGGGGW